jgi:SAM-dependent methyltransferase
MFRESAAIYDAVHGSRHDFASSAKEICKLVDLRNRSIGRTLLDVACGTGAYLVHLCAHFEVEGIDVSPEMAAIAREKLPGVPIYEANMIDFNLGRRFDVILCLGSSIGYAKTVAGLRGTMLTLSNHLQPGGVVLVEPWISPEIWEDGRVTADLIDEPNLKIARVLLSGLLGRVSTLDIHYLVAHGRTVDTFVEHHELGLFTTEEYLGALRDAGFTVEFDSNGPLGRGLYIGTKDLT